MGGAFKDNPIKNVLGIMVKAIGFFLLPIVILALIAFIYGWISRGLFITTEDIKYPQPENFRVILPRDYAAHPDFKTEWWYYTGHLESDDGRRFGFELVFFHIRTLGVWYKHQPLWWFFKTHLTAAQLAILDKTTGQHTVMERRAKNSKSNVGADVNNLRVWVYDWSAEGGPDAKGRFVTHLKAQDSRYSLDLNLIPAKPAVLHGQNGLLDKRPNGAASNYISFTRLFASGTLTENGKPLAVKGQAWHDHEYSSGRPGPQTAGWDWFSIQLGRTAEPHPDAKSSSASKHPLDGAELMFYFVRSVQGGVMDGSKATLVRPDGTSQPLSFGKDFQYRSGTSGAWKSLKTGALYPLGWTIAIPSQGWKIEIKPSAQAQEVVGQSIDVNYWEGACEVAAYAPEGMLPGLAYVELTGYDRRVDKF